MSRPFRYDAPDIHGTPVLRESVQRSLSERFDRRITVLTAGAGFGKTTAIVQAFEENRLAPLGSDMWLACQTADNEAHTIAAALSTMFNLQPPDLPSQIVDVISEACAALSPSEVCLVFDDVHHIIADSEGANILQQLVKRLPANGHLLFSGRTTPPLPLSRLQATGQSVTIGPDQLQLTTTEVKQISEQRGGTEFSESDIERLAGWPALVELALTYGRPAEFVSEEVVDWLDSTQLELLCALVAVGEADIDLLTALTGTDDTQTLESIPLVQRRGESFAAHDLWHEFLGDREDVTALRVHAMQHLIDERRMIEAVEMSLRHRPTAPDAIPQRIPAADDALNDLRDVALRGALITFPPPEPTTLRRWRSLIPTGPQASSADLLLTGLIRRLDSPGSDATHDALTAAAESFRGHNDVEGEVGALAALSFALHVRRDGGALIATFGRLSELADGGSKEALPYQQLAKALVATAMHDYRDTIEHAERLVEQTLPTEIRAVALWLLANARNNVGESSVDISEECVSLGVALPGLSMAINSARWRAGIIQPLLDEPEQKQTGDREQFLYSVWRTIIHGGVGDLEAAERHLKIVNKSVGNAHEWQSTASMVIPQVIVAYERGRHEEAKSAVRAMVDEYPLDGIATGYYVNAVGLVYALMPDVREYFDQRDDLGPLYQRDLQLNQALVAAAETGDLSLARTIDLPDSAGGLLPGLGCSRSAELLAACWAAEHPDAQDLVADYLRLLGENGRRAFRQAESHTEPSIAQGARAIIESTPVPPAESVALSLLGGTTLQIDGTIVETPDWRRGRVRALLTFLVLNPDTTREATIAALWPDADNSAGRRNLRSTLNVLNAVLEPARHGGDAPFFVRSVGQILRLHCDGNLDVDVDRFEQYLEEATAHEKAGAPSLSIEPYRQATSEYRGDLLPDAYDDWVLFARDRLRSRYVAAAVRCGELLVATGRASEAIDVIAPVLAIEPWSEPAHRTLIAAHLETGDTAAARRALKTCREALEDIGGLSEEATLALERRLSRR